MLQQLVSDRPEVLPVDHPDAGCNERTSLPTLAHFFGAIHLRCPLPVAFVFQWLSEETPPGCDYHTISRGGECWGGCIDRRPGISAPTPIQQSVSSLSPILASDRRGLPGFFPPPSFRLRGKLKTPSFGELFVNIDHLGIPVVALGWVAVGFPAMATCQARPC